MDPLNAYKQVNDIIYWLFIYRFYFWNAFWQYETKALLKGLPWGDTFSLQYIRGENLGLRFLVLMIIPSLDKSQLQSPASNALI